MGFDEIKDKVLEVADMAVKYAKDSKVPSAEAFVYNQKIVNVSDNNGKVDNRSGLTQGVGIRVAVGKKVGFASCSGFNTEAVKETIDKAHRIAKESPENPMFNGFMDDSKPAKDGLLDPEIANFDANTLAEIFDTIASEIDRDDQRIISVGMGANTNYRAYAVGTTEGCLVSSLNTTIAGFCNVVAMEQGLRKTASDFAVGRKIPSFEGIGETAIRRALDGLGAKDFEGSEVLPTVWEPRYASNYLGFALGFLCSGSSYVEQSNPWKDKLDQKIAVEEFTVIDDGQSPEYFGTSAIDTEGTPQQKTDYIVNGVLKTFLFNRMFGEAAGKKTTGNAGRNAVVPYEGVPSIAPHQLVVKNVGKNLDEQIAELDKGVLIRGNPIGLFTTNQATGDFSVTCSHAFLIEKGEVAHPLKTISIAGNYFKTFNDIMAIGSDREITGGGLDSPTMTFNNHTISA